MSVRVEYRHGSAWVPLRQSFPTQRDALNAIRGLVSIYPGARIHACTFRVLAAGGDGARCTGCGRWQE